MKRLTPREREAKARAIPPLRSLHIPIIATKVRGETVRLPRLRFLDRAIERDLS